MIRTLYYSVFLKCIQFLLVDHTIQAHHNVERVWIMDSESHLMYCVMNTHDWGYISKKGNGVSKMDPAH